jgi:dihydrodipicolinate reductase
MIKVVLIGSGNVAQHLIQVFLQAKEVALVQAVARNPSPLVALLPMDKSRMIIKKSPKQTFTSSPFQMMLLLR